MDICNEAKELEAKSKLSKSLKNLQDLASMGKPDVQDLKDRIEKFVGDDLGFTNKKDEPKPEVPVRTFSIDEKSNLNEYRKLIEDQKVAMDSTRRFKQEILKRSDSLDSIKIVDPNDLIEVRDPAETSNYFVEIKDFEESSTIKETGRICIDIETKEIQEQIVKDTQSHLGRNLVNSIDMRLLDDIAKQTYQLEGELRQISKLKMDTHEGVLSSLSKAETALRAERKLQIIKILEEMVKIVPDCFYELDPENQKHFRDANHKIECALRLYKKAADLDLNPAEGKAKEAILDAITLWPEYKEDPRVVTLVDRLLQMD